MNLVLSPLPLPIFSRYLGVSESSQPGAVVSLELILRVTPYSSPVLFDLEGSRRSPAMIAIGEDERAIRKFSD